jgi:hypothetical protein
MVKARLTLLILALVTAVGCYFTWFGKAPHAKEFVTVNLDVSNDDRDFTLWFSKPDGAPWGKAVKDGDIKKIEPNNEGEVVITRYVPPGGMVTVAAKTVGTPERWRFVTVGGLEPGDEITVKPDFVEVDDVNTEIPSFDYFPYPRTSDSVQPKKNAKTGFDATQRCASGVMIPGICISFSELAAKRSRSLFRLRPTQKMSLWLAAHEMTA